MRRQFRTTVTAIVLVLLGHVSATAAAGPPFELSVKRDRAVGGSSGTLVFTADGVEYKTAKADDARRWSYEDVRQLQILSPTRIAVLTYENGRRLKMGADRTFNFKVTQNSVSQELVTFLLERVTRPVVTAVMPAYGGEPIYRVRVKHQRQGRGSEGTLLLYDAHLLYLTEQEDGSRFWRFGDIYSVQKLDRYRLEVNAYEGGGARTRAFVFELKTDLPERFYDDLWARVNPSTLDLASPAGNQLAATQRP
jgi:hypothetical protein